MDTVLLCILIFLQVFGFCFLGWRLFLVKKDNNWFTFHLAVRQGMYEARVEKLEARLMALERKGDRDGEI